MTPTKRPNSWRVSPTDPNVIEISLTLNKVALVSREDFELVRRFRWCAERNGERWYAVSRTSGTRVRLHRLILGLTDPELWGDHVDADGLNNSRENLRIVTAEENKINSRAQIGNASSFKGVSWDAHAQKWQAVISAGGKRHHLGYFPGPIVASYAYDAAARELHGPFARVNHPKPGEQSARRRLF